MFLVKTGATEVASLVIKTEEEYAFELYVPFPSPPLTYTEVDHLKDLLLTPLLQKLPLPTDLVITTTQSAIFEHRNAKTPFMSIQFYHALNRCLPPTDSSWEGYYDCFLQEAWQSNYVVFRGFTINRKNVSMAIKRDLNVWYESLLLFCGEDHTKMNMAIADLQAKNKGKYPASLCN